MEKKYNRDTYESDDGIHWSKVEKDNLSQQCKKGKGVLLHNLLEPRSKAGEDTETVMPVDVDNHSADNNLSESCEVKE